MAIHIWEETKKVAEIMREAAKKEIMPRFGKVKREEKEGASGKELVTEADIKASEFILERVRKDFPGSYSEEHLYEDRFNYERVWQFDPLDGTSDFCSGMLDGFAMHGAFLERNPEGKYDSKAGIIYLPGIDKLWMADDEHFTFKNNGLRQKIPEVRRDLLRGWIWNTDIRETDKVKYDNNGKVVHPLPLHIKTYKNIADKLGKRLEIIPGGGSGASFSDLLEGKINVLVINWDSSKEWDIAMAEPLVKKRGGFLCSFDGNDYKYNRKDSLNRAGYVSSIAFSKEEIMPHIYFDTFLKKGNT